MLPYWYRFRGPTIPGAIGFFFLWLSINFVAGCAAVGAWILGRED